MKHALLILLMTCAACAQAPDSWGGDYLFVEAGRTTARTSFQRGLLLAPDGSFRGLFGAGTRIAESVFFNSQIGDGRWSYRKTAADRAELTLTHASDPQRPELCTLVFTGPASGQIEDLSLARFGRTFGLRPPGTGNSLTNTSNRSFLPAGRSAFTGFVVGGTGRRMVLVRAVGASLAAFGVEGALADPVLRLRQNGVLFAENDDWDGTQPAPSAESIRRAGAIVAAFPLQSGSKDAAIVMELPPGAYVVEVSSRSADAGEVLTEVYLLP
jgi:hypothetical protein